MVVVGVVVGGSKGRLIGNVNGMAAQGSRDKGSSRGRNSK